MTLGGVWRLTGLGNCDRHAVGEEVKVVVLGELSVDASKTPARITQKRTGPDGKSNLGVGIVRFRAGLCEIAKYGGFRTVGSPLFEVRVDVHWHFEETGGLSSISLHYYVGFLGFTKIHVEVQ